MSGYLLEMMRVQALAIAHACPECGAGVPCQRCGAPGSTEVGFYLDSSMRVGQEHEHLCERCAARGREVHGGVHLGGPDLRGWARGGRARKAGGRRAAQRAKREWLARQRQDPGAA
jgi:hypothetical protein